MKMRLPLAAWVSTIPLRQPPRLTALHAPAHRGPSKWSHNKQQCGTWSKRDNPDVYNKGALVGLPWVDPDAKIGTSYDSIFVLAGGLRPDGSLPTWVQRRLDASAHVQERQRNPCPIVALGGGTPHKPPVLDKGGYVVHEATMCSSYLLSKASVDPNRLLKEISSYDTVGNAFFALTIHALPAGWRNIVVITSEFHMPRSRALFEDMCKLAETTFFTGNDRFHLDFIPVSDEGIFQEEVLQGRKEREAKSLEAWKRNFKGLKTFPELHQWLHATHLCYSVSRQDEFGRQGGVEDVVLKSY